MKRIIPVTIACLTLSHCSKKEEPAVEFEQPQTEAPTEPSRNDFIAEDIEIKDITSPTAQELNALLEFKNADAYLERLSLLFSEAQSAEDFSSISSAIGSNKLSDQQLSQLQKLLREHKLDTDTPFEQIGEITANKHARWAINLKDSAPIVLDVKRDPKGNWQIDKVALPDGNATPENGAASTLPNSDALNSTHSFLKSLLTQDFKKAKTMVDASNITDAKLAGLCIIFEEAEYKIDPNKPLRSLFMRDTAAGFYVNVISNSGEKAAQFSIIAQRENAASDWKIYEINLDSLLGDYAKRVTDGDVYFTPLLKNPEGGDTLVIYFEFDSEGLTQRTQKQLDIVSSILAVDPNRTINISGHTDSKGSTDYNNTLSNKRAETVKNYFIEQGIAPAQVITEAYGDRRPRLDNTNSDGSDNPEGRRANRRTEIYLDF